MLEWLIFFFSLFSFVVSLFAVAIAIGAAQIAYKTQKAFSSLESRLVEMLGYVGRLAKKVDDVNNNFRGVH